MGRFNFETYIYTQTEQMKKIIWMFSYCLIAFAMSCSNSNGKYSKLEMTNEEIVNVFVQIYSVNAANQLNDPAVRDSMANVYMEQVSRITGKSVMTIKSDLDKLKQMPDSLYVLQSAALDTLRAIYEKNYYKTKEGAN